ncbi:MAG: hypothetical protein EOP88_01965 [Verrucomicrobiaceae bacterium]|nr:MAG: hypothetical protein EOP88_01965 [Verrucomicrobiaceae bacterium]
MKPKAWLLPLATIIAAACFLISQSRAISSTKRQAENLQKQITVTGRNGDSATTFPEDPAFRRQATAKGSINWQRFAELTGGYGGAGIFARQELLRAEKRIQAMSPEELLAALATTKDLELDGRSRGEIQGRLITALGEKDPAAALTCLIAPDADRMLNGGIMDRILTKWIHDDFTAALAWFDGKIADGSLDSKSVDGSNHRRFAIEGGLLDHLSMSDPETAARRLTAYPEAYRANIFEQLTWSFKTEDEGRLVARMELARAALTPQAQAKILTDSIKPLSRSGDYTKIDAFLEKVSATPQERADSMAQASKERFMQVSRRDQLDIAEIDRFREWAAGHSLDKIDESAGKALAATSSSYRSGRDSVEKIRELLSHYQDTNGNDDMLMGFLSGGAFNGQRDKIRLLAGDIRDPELRADYLKRLESDPFAQ